MTRLEFCKTMGYNPSEEERKLLLQLETRSMDRLYFHLARGNLKFSYFMHLLIMYDMFYGERSVSIAN